MLKSDLYLLRSNRLLKRFTNTHRSPDLNQMICNLRSEVPIWFKWFTIRAPKFRSKSKDSQTIVSDRTLDRESLNSQNDLRTRSKVPIWIKWFAIHAPNFRSESKDSWTIISDRDFGAQSTNHSVHEMICEFAKWLASPLQSSDLNQMIYKPARSKSNDLWYTNNSQTPTKFPIWIQLVSNLHQSFEFESKNCEPAPKFWSKSYDSRSTLLNPDLKNDSWTIISDQDSERGSQSFNSWNLLRSPRSESNDLRTCSDLNKMIHYLRSEVPIWISDQNSGHGLRIIQLAKWCSNLLRSPALNQMICEPAPKFRSK